MVSPYVVISGRGDGHIPFVDKHMDEPLLVVDPYDIIKGVPLSFRFDGRSFEPFYNGQSLSGTRSVWYRKPELSLSFLDERDDGRNEYVRHCLSLFMRQLYGLLPDARWVSGYYEILRASDKLWQLSLAKQLGFRIPDTLVTSSAREAQEFVGSRGTAIVKLIEVKQFKLENEVRMTLTRKVDSQSADFSGLHLAPSILQEAIDVALDIRVTVVGDKVFAASIKPAGGVPQQAEVRDWRATDYAGDSIIEAFELPSSLAAKCASFVKEMGLLYGAIDLLLDKKGKFWFLENNPNGQWAFVEEATGQPIGKTIAGLLMRSE